MNKQKRDIKGRFLPVDQPKTEVMKVTKQEKVFILKMRKIAKILASKSQYDSYRYYCTYCLYEGKIRSTTNNVYDPRIETTVDVCKEHYKLVKQQK